MQRFRVIFESFVGNGQFWVQSVYSNTFFTHDEANLVGISFPHFAATINPSRLPVHIDN